MRLGKWVLASAVSILLSWSGPSFATVVKAVPLDVLASISRWVVIGTVTSTKCHYEMIGGIRRIVTESSVKIESVIGQRKKEDGLTSKLITVKTLGGTLEGVTEVTLGEAVLLPGEKHLLFLDQENFDAVHVVAMAQGQYWVKTDGRGHSVVYASTGLDVVLDRAQSAVTALSGKTLEQAKTLVNLALKQGASKNKKAL
jgi:hypothetical protein